MITVILTFGPTDSHMGSRCKPGQCRCIHVLFGSRVNNSIDKKYFVSFIQFCIQTSPLADNTSEIIFRLSYEQLGLYYYKLYESETGVNYTLNKDH